MMPKLSRSFAVLSLAFVMLISTQAAAMQNIKCIPADRAMLKKWTSTAKTTLTNVRELRQGKSAKLDQLDESVASMRTSIDPEKFASKELRERMQQVQQELETSSQALKKADAKERVKILERLETLLNENTVAKSKAMR